MKVLEILRQVLALRMRFKVAILITLLLALTRCHGNYVHIADPLGVQSGVTISGDNNSVFIENK